MPTKTSERVRSYQSHVSWEREHHVTKSTIPTLQYEYQYLYFETHTDTRSTGHLLRKRTIRKAGWDLQGIRKPESHLLIICRPRGVRLTMLGFLWEVAWDVSSVGYHTTFNGTISHRNTNDPMGIFIALDILTPS